MDKASISQGSQVTWQLQSLVLERLVSCRVLSRIIYIVAHCGGDTWTFDSSICDDPQLIIKAGGGGGVMEQMGWLCIVKE